MMNYLWVAIGSALGGMARYWCSDTVARFSGEWFPWGTLIVNVSGSFIIGLFAALSGTDSRFLIPPEARIFVMTGLCGGYTTFSSFSLQTFTLWREGECRRKLRVFCTLVPCCSVAGLRCDGRRDPLNRKKHLLGRDQKPSAST
jgi:CrcB protein